MKKGTKIIIVSIASIVIVTFIVVLTLSYAFMKTQVENSSVTEVNLTSCAKLTLTDISSIKLENTYPMSKNQALKNTPYTFTVTSSCEENVGFNLYLATLNTNTLDASKIRYIITNTGTTTIIKEGLLGNLTDVSASFTSEEITEYNIGINGTVGSIYMLYNEEIPLKGSLTYDLYLYLDSEVSSGNSQSETFVSGIAVKSYSI